MMRAHPVVVVVLAVVVVVASAVAGSCASTTALAIPRQPGEVFVTGDNGGGLAIVAHGSVEDVYRRAHLAGCRRDGISIVCDSRHATNDAKQRARFVVGTAAGGEVVVVSDDGFHDRVTLRGILLTLGNGEEDRAKERTPPAPPLLR